jgi:thiol-disulfide isomerase/thioredoxin
MSKKLPIFAVLAVAALAAGAWFAQMRYAPQAVAPQTVSALWPLQFPDWRGQPQALSQWRGKVLVLNFWATWCAPCREEMPDFDVLRRQYQSRGVEFVGIAIDNEKNVAQFLQTMPVSYPILIGEGAALTLARQLGNNSGALPYTLVIDSGGNIALSHLGMLPRERLDKVLQGLIP